MVADGPTKADPEEKSADGSNAETRNTRSQREKKVRKPAAHTEGVRLPMVRAGGLRPAADVAEDMAQSKSVFERPNPLLWQLARHAPAQHGECIRGA